jgi:hypothetical protein
MANSDLDAQLTEIGALLNSQIDELAHRVADSIRSNVEIYRNPSLITDEELLRDTADKITLVFQALESGTAFDTTAATVTGHNRATAGVPLPAVMEAFRVASHHVWDTMIELARDHPRISGPALLVATSKFWQAQDRYTDAMASAYRQQAMSQLVEDEAERSALTEALLEGRPLGDYSLWEVAQLLRIPTQGPYAVITATLPRVGRQALPGVAASLRSFDVFSAWRLLPDIQIGIAQLPSEAARTNTIELLKRTATTRVGISPKFDDLANTARALRYARIAMGARSDAGTHVVVFEESVLAVAAVSAPEVTRTLAEISLGSFGDLSGDEKKLLLDTFRAWLDNDGSIPDAAAALFCHPNTVRYRLRRIEQRTGRSLSNPRQLAELCLALEVTERT